ncbi:thioredoxin domain-containing protein [Candidatus Protochlamydia naegleriophila]|uniref:thioredoxin domain-containing protein n=1 Tax=Candidatus Protochlamydia naegleriophila TaxID=389348 RepID=UPI00130173A1|nr:thioredoxin domain-containing protein [Candidatus Protochlamydia naegleriophila]
MNKAKTINWSFWIVGLALIAGLILSILSWLELCVEHCSANQHYRLFGFPFASVGMAFFITTMVIHFSSKQSPLLKTITGWLIAMALGSEIMFILIQKFQIGHWCPVCLSIAVSIAIAGLALSWDYIKTIYSDIQQGNRGNIMSKIKQGLTSFSFILLGFLMAFIGVGKSNEAEAAVTDMKGRLAFGSKTSPVEVYFVTDWFCPSCKKVEPQIEKIFPTLQSQVAFYFIDYPIHKKSLNFTPYNLAFLINSKPQYLKARQALAELTDKTETPTDNDIAKAVKPYNIPFKELSFLDVKTGMEFFDKIVEKYNLNATPTIIITNTKSNKVIKFEGRDEISEEKILEAIESMNKAA